MRAWVYRDLINKLDLQAHTTNNDTLKTYYRSGYLLLRNTVFRNPLFADQHDYLFFTNGRRKLQDDGYWWNLYTDPIHTEGDLDYLHVETDYNMKHYTPARTDNLRYIDFLQYTDALKRRLGLVTVKLDQETKTALEAVTEEFEKRLGVTVDLAERARHYLRIRKSRRPLYKRLLSRVDPELAVIQCSYGKQTFIELCKQQNIPVAEIQHSMINQKHIGYIYPHSQEIITFPDYFLTWGDFWRDQFDYPISDDRIITVGYPYLEKSVGKYTDIDSGEQILFISQGSIGEQLSQFAVKLSQQPGMDHTILYKLHPTEYDQWKEMYPWLVNADIDVISDSPPLYQLFAESSIQVGVYSTALYEGLCFGLETYLYDCSISTLQALIDQGSAKSVSTVDQLMSYIDEQPATFDRDYYFAPNATDRTQQVLKELATEKRKS
jgi:hypothetical protein